MSRAFANFQLLQAKVTIRRDGQRLQVTVEGPMLQRIVIDVERGDLVIPAGRRPGSLQEEQ